MASNTTEAKLKRALTALQKLEAKYCQELIKKEGRFNTPYELERARTILKENGIEPIRHPRRRKLPSEVV